MAEQQYVHLEVQAIAHDMSLYSSEFASPPETDELLAWLGRLRLLNGVPFAYLVNDAELLPTESIRFFYLDRNWADAALDGALSVGTITTRDRTQLRSVYTELRDDVDEAERQLFQSKTGSQVTEGDAEVVTGFLLRSRAVSGWPGLHVHAFRGPGEVDELGIIRIERLAPAVLLVLLDGLPEYVTITEPRQGIQFGVQPHSTDADRRTFLVRNDDGTPDKNVAEAARLVPFRKDSPGVIHWKDFAARLDTALGPEPDEVNSALTGLNMLRFPYVQDFGDDGGGSPAGGEFKHNVGLEILTQSNAIDWFDS